MMSDFSGVDVEVEDTVEEEVRLHSGELCRVTSDPRDCFGSQRDFLSCTLSVSTSRPPSALHNDKMSLSSEPVNSDLLANSHDPQNVKVEQVLQDSDALETERTTTPPSSPPVYEKQEQMAPQSQEMPPPTAPASKTRKRSRGESVDVAIRVPDSSATTADDIDPLASQDKERDSTTDSTATVMQNQRLARSSQQAPPSAQPVETSQRQRTTARAEKASKTAPSRPAQEEIRNEASEPYSDLTTASNDPGLPEDPLEDYDWSELETRYHDRMSEMHATEEQIFRDLNDLIAVKLSLLVSTRTSANISTVLRSMGRRWRPQRDGSRL